MSSEVDICNLALSHLGDEASLASIDPPEGSAQADHCAKFYPIARDLMLEKHPWKFATRRVLLSPVDVDLWEMEYGTQASFIDCLCSEYGIDLWMLAKEGKK